MERPALRVQRHAALRAHFTFLPFKSKTFHFCAVGIFHVFVYDDNYAGQTSIRVHRRVMDLRVDLDKGAAGNTLAVLSRRICAKACVKTRPTACPHSACPAEKIRVRSGTAPFCLSLIAVPRRTYRVGAADISHFAVRRVRLTKMIATAKYIASGARAHFFAYRSLRPCAGHKKGYFHFFI